jgi:hypothetical protein
MPNALRSNLFARLRLFRAEAFTRGQSIQSSALRSELAAIPNEDVRSGALERLHILMVCAAVMRMDPLNYQRAVGRAFDNLISYLESHSAHLPEASNFGS